MWTYYRPSQSLEAVSTHPTQLNLFPPDAALGLFGFEDWVERWQPVEEATFVASDRSVRSDARSYVRSFLFLVVRPGAPFVASLFLVA